KSEKRVDLKAMAKMVGVSSFSFASSEELSSILSLSPGAVTPMGLLNDEEKKVKFYLDNDFKEGQIYVHPMENTSSLLLDASSLFGFLSSHGAECNWIDIKTKEE
ncbi:MAG: YbaK/EbsC family protein, partial [Candidatus Ornithospirochaeta sp.]